MRRRMTDLPHGERIFRDLIAGGENAFRALAAAGTATSDLYVFTLPGTHELADPEERKRRFETEFLAFCR